jgi:hypothetical protein
MRTRNIHVERKKDRERERGGGDENRKRYVESKELNGEEREL